jgi:hypothetical protein
MRYHEELNTIRAILFYAALVVIAVGLLIEYVRR